MPFTPLLYQLFLCKVYLKYESQRMRMANKGGRILWRRKKESYSFHIICFLRLMHLARGLADPDNSVCDSGVTIMALGRRLCYLQSEEWWGWKVEKRRPLDEIHWWIHCRELYDAHKQQPWDETRLACTFFRILCLKTNITVIVYCCCCDDDDDDDDNDDESRETAVLEWYTLVYLEREREKSVCIWSVKPEIFDKIHAQSEEFSHESEETSTLGEVR